MIILAKMIRSHLPRLGIVLVLLSFGVMTGLAPVLHAHELDFSSAHDDCAPCHWSHSNQTVETTTTTITPALLFQFQIFSSSKFISQQFKNNILNRGPPSLS